MEHYRYRRSTRKRVLDHFNVGQMRERRIPIAQGVAEALLSEATKSLSVLGHKKHILYQSIVGKLMSCIQWWECDLTSHSVLVYSKGIQQH
jgi:hypothetical protein